MEERKIKEKVRGKVKELNKTISTSNKFKNNVINLKDKTKEAYSTNNESEVEYATNKLEGMSKSATNNIVALGDTYGRKSVKYIYNRKKEEIKNKKEFESRNIVRNESSNNIKLSSKDIKNKLNYEKTNNISNRIKTNPRQIKSSIITGDKKIKNYESIIEQTEKNVEKSKKTAQKLNAIKDEIVKSSKKVADSIIKLIKFIIEETKLLITGLIAMGWVGIVIIIVICMIGFLVTSVFGIFFSDEYQNSISISKTVQDLNKEFVTKITDIQNSNEHNEYDITGTRAEWKEILAVFVAKYSNGNYEIEMMTLDDNKINELKKVFWEMNEINYNVEKIEQVEYVQEGKKTKKVVTYYKKLHINIKKHNILEMADKYNFSQKQREMLLELLKDDYLSLWSNIIYGSFTGNGNIISVAQTQLGNIGGEPYWSWYGFSSRVEWCACFVSWCANECGYIDSGVIPKFAGCEAEGVAWFKACGLWQDSAYIPKARRYNIF